MDSIEELGGYRYKLGEVDYIVSVQRYNTTGEAVITIAIVRDRDGYVFREPETRLTYNLDGLDHQHPFITLGDKEIFTKSDMLKHNEKHLDKLGFEFTGKEVVYGPLEKKAQVWVLK